MHLTNYSLNKNNDQFEKTDDFSKGSKRNFTFLNEYLRQQGQDPDETWADISSIIIKTIISIQPQLKHQYRSCMGSNTNGDFCCFEILGFDIFLDEKLAPWLLEVNHSPSFNTDTLLDRVVKTSLITETMKLLALDPNDRVKCRKEDRAKAMERIKTKNIAPVIQISPEEKSAKREKLHKEHTEAEESIMSNFYRIYPCDGHEQYDKFLECAVKIAVKTGDPLALTMLTRPPIGKKRDLPTPSPKTPEHIISPRHGSMTARPSSSLSQNTKDEEVAGARSASSFSNKHPTSPRITHLMAPLSPRENRKPKNQVPSRYLSSIKPPAKKIIAQPKTHEYKLPKQTLLVLDLPGL